MNYERIKYPDGQISAKVNLSETIFNPYKIITERINSYEDLFFIRSIAEAIPNINEYRLIIPCLFGQRSDRRFTHGQSFDLKLIAEVINNCKFNEVGILDPHSDVSLALINNSYKISSFNHVKDAFDAECIINDIWGVDKPIIISPDAGAYKKCFEYGEKLQAEVVAAVKYRDSNGKINLKFIGDVDGKNCLIVDDLIDGGATFINLSKELEVRRAKKVCLYVTHGYFSKGFEILEEAINHIYCTNSVKDIDHAFVTQFKVI